MKKWITRIWGALALSSILALGACEQQPENKDDVATPVRAQQVATAPQPQATQPAPVIATVVQIDSCKDSIMAANNLTNRSARRLGTKTYQYGTLSVTTNERGIWGGCKAALERPLASQPASTNVDLRAKDARIQALEQIALYTGPKLDSKGKAVIENGRPVTAQYTYKARVAALESVVADKDRQIQSLRTPWLLLITSIIAGLVAGLIIGAIAWRRR